VMNSSYQPGTLAPLVPDQVRTKKSKKGLWIGLGIGVILLFCVASLAVVFIERNRIPGLADLLNSKAPLSIGSKSAQGENATWLVKVDSVEYSNESVYDSQGGSASPKAGFTFLVVKTSLVNKGTDSQTLMVGLGGGDAQLVDAKGKSYSISAVRRGSSVTINSSSTLTMMYIYPNAPDGEPTDFIFAVPAGTVPHSLKFKDLPPIGPLPKP
jgi:hypothetical protein